MNPFTRGLQRNKNSTQSELIRLEGKLDFALLKIAWLQDVMELQLDDMNLLMKHLGLKFNNEPAKREIVKDK